MLSEEIIGVGELQAGRPWSTTRLSVILWEKGRLVSWSTTLGFMAVDISAPNRVRIPTDDPFEGDPKLLALDAKGFLSYCGPFSIVSDNEVIHHLRLCSFENWVGTDQQRNAELNENTLTLSTAPRLLLGKQGVGGLTWKRVTTFK